MNTVCFYVFILICFVAFDNFSGTQQHNLFMNNLTALALLCCHLLENSFNLLKTDCRTDYFISKLSKQKTLPLIVFKHFCIVFGLLPALTL